MPFGKVGSILRLLQQGRRVRWGRGLKEFIDRAEVTLAQVFGSHAHGYSVRVSVQDFKEGGMTKKVVSQVHLIVSTMGQHHILSADSGTHTHTGVSECCSHAQIRSYCYSQIITKTSSIQASSPHLSLFFSPSIICQPRYTVC